ncbi:putative DNA-binding protein (MmcQ/YjbR family) [Mucilaginibacter yixingensis]|uniref:Putative DNA-binding protein (MmcQ/YjbR family) n=1 Tax=Mucilaginibacter yixingensis TaxID=1295612 RepID=A0A2T5JEM2_9SPHI|nr:MmcQ/YjbR family DNA-binding protein [Mucilaginibacter yixingensis]PTR00873.1 putative DNA-binding protein (MmcQ/YjbR family) [Mucilaginibacter yixingensis]
MNVESLRDYCLSLQGTTEDMPFGEETLAFRIGEKIFLLISLDTGNRFNVKCDPELAVQLREQHNEVQPGYHMNKKHWNTIYMDGNLSDKQLREMIHHSYTLVLQSLPKRLQDEIRAVE